MDSSLPSVLINLGNACNVTLQAILYIPFLQEYINKHKEYSKNCYCQYHNDIYKCTLSYIMLYMLDKEITKSLHAGGD